MTQEDKKLLMQDLCSRLPYKVNVQNERRKSIVTLTLCVMSDLLVGCSVKPYLRPLSSMTDEEWEEYDNFCDNCRGAEYFELIDWLNSHHFDYRNLIERGLAIAVTEENNPYKE